MNDGTLTRYRFEARFTLIQLGVIQGVLGFYALFFPRSFYEDFPFGLGWVEALPAYNEHLLTDFGGLFLATAVMLIAASIRLERRWVVITLVAFLAFSLPHTLWHLFNLEVYSTGDAIANAVTLAATVLLPIGVLFLVARESRAPAKPEPAEPGTNGLRIEGVPDSTRNPITRASFAVSRRRYGDVVDPMRVYAHNPDRDDGLHDARVGSRARDSRARAPEAPRSDARGDGRRLRVVPRLRLVSLEGPRGHPGGDARAASLPGLRRLRRNREARHGLRDRHVAQPGRGLRGAVRAAPRALRRGAARRARGHRRARELPRALQLGLRPRGPGLLRGSIRASRPDRRRRRARIRV